MSRKLFNSIDILCCTYKLPPLVVLFFEGMGGNRKYTHARMHTHTHIKTIWQIMMSVIRGNNREMKWVDLEFLSEDGVCKLRLKEN